MYIVVGAAQAPARRACHAGGRGLELCHSRQEFQLGRLHALYAGLRWARYWCDEAGKPCRGTSFGAFVTGFTIEDIETIDVDILDPHCTPSFSWGCRVCALVDAVSHSCVRSSAAWRSRSSAVRNLASHTQSAPARSALIRCQAASLSNLPIVSHGSSDINVTSRKDTDRFQVALG